MKTKIFKYGALFLGAAMLLPACTDTLEKEPLDGFQNNPEFWNGEYTVTQYANEYYEAFTAYGNAGGSGLFYFKTLSDDQAGNSFAEWTFTNVPSSSSDWKATYEEIRRANIMIKGLETSTLEPSVKNHWLGVARMMRAYQFFDIVRKFGDVKWVDRPLDVTDSEYLYAARDDRDMVMDKVLEDLKFAATNIEETTSKVTWNRGMANAMMADICLWEGTFRKYRSTDVGQKAPDLEGSKRFLEACVEACQYVMNHYSISDDYRAIYNSTDLSSNPEIIFFKAYKKDVLMHSLIDYTCSSTQISGMTKDAFESYLFLDGKPAASTTMDKTDKGVLDKDGNINIENLLAVRDKRLAETIDPIVFYPGNTWKRTEDGMEMTSSTGYGICKYDNTSIPTGYRNQTGKNYTAAPIYWLSVVYLNYAEAKAELGTLTDDDLIQTINKLRKRAGLPDATVAGLKAINDPKNNTGVESLIWEIRRERRCELMFDNWFRYWDLIRWHQLDKLDSTQNPDILLGARVDVDPNITKPDPETGEPAVTMVNGYMDGSKGMERKYEAKHYFYPIPSGQIILNPALGQNPGWPKTSGK